MCVCVGSYRYMPLALAAGQRTHDCCACPGPQAANLMRMINLPMEAENGKWLHLPTNKNKDEKQQQIKVFKIFSKSNKITEIRIDKFKMASRRTVWGSHLAAAARSRNPRACRGVPCSLSQPHDSNQSDCNKRYTAEFYKWLTGCLVCRSDSFRSWTNAPRSCPSCSQTHSRIQARTQRTNRSAGIWPLFSMCAWLVFGKCLPFRERLQKLLSLGSFVFIIVLRRAAKSFSPHYACEQWGIHLYMG